jgi:hypothetical protein
VILDQNLDHNGVKTKLMNDYDIPAKYLYEVLIPASYSGKAAGAGIEDIFAKADFARLLSEAGYPPQADFEHMSNSMYMTSKTRKKLKSLIADWFLQHIGDHKESDFDQETIGNMRTLMEFCINGAWFLKRPHK